MQSLIWKIAMDLLKKLTTLEHTAAEFGFKWETADQIMSTAPSCHLFK